MKFIAGPFLMLPTYSSEVLENFIVIEGIDGAGTSTQSALLERNLRAQGRRVVRSEEPTPGPVGTLIRQIMRGRLISAADRADTERQLSYLFAADRFDHLHNSIDGIRSQVQRDVVAISTRYYFSSYVYNARTPETFDLVDRLNRDFPVPKVVVYLYVPLEVSMARLGQRDVLEFYEKEEELRRVADNYQRVLKPLGDRVVSFESVGDPEEIGTRVAKAVLERL